MVDCRTSAWLDELLGRGGHLLGGRRVLLDHLVELLDGLVHLGGSGALFGAGGGDFPHQFGGLLNVGNQLRPAIGRRLRRSARRSTVRRLISAAAVWLRSASLRTSDATTAKPLPCSPARAASTAAFRASRSVLRAISSMMLIFSATCFMAPDGAHHRIAAGPCVLRGLGRDLVGLPGVVGILLNAGGHLFHGGSAFLRGGRLLGRALRELLRGGAHLVAAGGDVRRRPRPLRETVLRRLSSILVSACPSASLSESALASTVKSPSEIRVRDVRRVSQMSHHPVHGREHTPEFIRGSRLDRVSQVPLRHLADQADGGRQRPRDAAYDEQRDADTGQEGRSEAEQNSRPRRLGGILDLARVFLCRGLIAGHQVGRSLQVFRLERLDLLAHQLLCQLVRTGASGPAGFERLVACGDVAVAGGHQGVEESPLPVACHQFLILRPPPAIEGA